MAKAINSWIPVDFETGGTDPKKHAVMEVAMVAFKGDTLEKIDLLSTYVKPYGSFEYDPEALKHNGISFDDIESGKDIHEVVDEIIELLAKCDFNPRNKGSKPILVAHNSAFDKGFLVQIFTFCKKMKELEKLTFGNTDYFGNYQPEMLDSQFFMKAAFGGDPDMTSFKLITCLEKLGIELPDAHKAINDTMGLKDGLSLLFNKLRSSGSQAEEIKSGKRFREHFQF